jgi:hypothetical protein
MSEAAIDPPLDSDAPASPGSAKDDETRTPPELDRAKDWKRMKSIATTHTVMVMGAITLWGAADAWAVSSDWALAWIVAMANALIASYIITSTLHEWGHFCGARLAGSFAPVLKKPARYFFMFNFPFEHNDTRQFLWMSWGGIITPWLLVLLTAIVIPIDNVSRAMLLAGFVARALQVSLFEVPVVRRTLNGGEPQAELTQQLEVGFSQSRYLSFAVGALVWLIV